MPAPLRCPSFPYALIIMSDILHKVEDVSIMLAPILAIYLLQSEFTLQVRSVLFLVLLELDLNFVSLNFRYGKPLGTYPLHRIFILLHRVRVMTKRRKRRVSTDLNSCVETLSCCICSAPELLDTSWLW